MSRICDLCRESAPQDTWTYEISDGKEKSSFTGHKNCIDELEVKFKSIKDYQKKSVKQVLKELNYKGE